jgi:ribosomal-protein-alanine N-acetyltransferase
MCVLETERLTLRWFQMSDFDALLQIFGDAEVMHFGYGVQTREWIQNWLRQRVDDDEHNRTTVWAVIEKASARVIGYCGLFYFPDIGGKPETEIGYRFNRQSWGLGYATEAARAVCDYAFHTLGLARLIAMIDPHNTTSVRVAEKLGMRYVKDIMFEGYTHPDMVYSIEC